MRHATVLPALLLAGVLLAAASHAQTRYQWVGGSSGEWTEPTNWSPVGVPAAADTAAIGPGNNAAILTATTTVAGLEVTGLGVVAGDFDLTVTGRLLWAGGGTGFETFRGVGTLRLAVGATGRMAEPTTRFQMFAGRTLVNDGTLVWDGSGTWGGQGRLVNNGELVLAMGETANVVFSSLADAITNSVTGVLRRTEDGATQISSGIVNEGLIRVENGTLDLGGFNSTGLTGTGSIEVQGGAELVLSGSASNTQASITGETVTVTAFNGRTTVTDTYDVTTTRIVGTAGGLVLDADATVSDVVMEGGFLGGSGTLTITNALAWSGGTMEGSGTTTLGPAIPLTIGGDATIRLGGSRTLRTEGPVTWTGNAGLSAGTSDTAFENAGTLTSSGPGERQVNFVTFRNTGTLLHDSGTLAFFGPLDNQGEIRIESGAVELNPGTPLTGPFNLRDAGRLVFLAATQVLDETMTISGTGTVSIAPFSFTNRATWRPGGDGVGTLTVEGNWPAMEPEGVLDMQVGGTAPGTAHDRLDVTGTFAAGGTLRVALTDGFTPAATDTLLLVAAGAGGTGTFAAAELPDTTPPGYVQAMSEGVRYGLGEPVAGEDDGVEALPTAFALGAPYPNPVATRATVAYAVPEAAPVRVAVYDVLGRAVAVLADGSHAAGRYQATLDATGLPSGLYVVRMEADGFAQTRRLTLVR